LKALKQAQGIYFICPALAYVYCGCSTFCLPTQFPPDFLFLAAQMCHALSPETATVRHAFMHPILEFHPAPLFHFSYKRHPKFTRWGQLDGGIDGLKNTRQSIRYDEESARVLYP
jgi:hypothetical protein